MSDLFTVGVTGSQTWLDASAVHRPLDALLRHHGRLHLKHGDASRGADRVARRWFERTEARHPGLVVHDPMAADWGLGRGAGMKRNREMVDSGMDVLLVFARPCRRNQRNCPPGEHPTHGTANCVEHARAAGIRVRFCPSGMKW